MPSASRCSERRHRHRDSDRREHRERRDHRERRSRDRDDDEYDYRSVRGDRRVRREVWDSARGVQGVGLEGYSSQQPLA